ncbi:L-rhamnose operon regulatory protein rhaS [uncultured Roseburia sp.]|uniref:AraC family transcriptional regulator n=1 Tax=Brotonthovivens ammoniilytica TaxID=2981725 RepID=A0ABT2TMH5_9FIRM|nr:AraC family transcriptional regulator [Brotonthovivens ammoniilytica]MCU6763433.1 AraC family transcriptional regulator [Brotonthovivens ammoniilytica]SCJ19073.1 L-rhamnose operon regulatory protein rhaS [uncultured Roseburia sp.]
MPPYKNRKIEIIEHNTISKLNFFILDITYSTAHIHSDLEVLYVVEGSLKIDTVDQSFTLSSGEMALFNPYQIHSCYAKTSLCLVLVTQIDVTFCQNYFPNITNLRFCTSDLNAVVPQKELKEMQDVCFHIAYNYFGQKLGFEFRCISDVNRLFDYFLQSVPHSFISEEERVTALNFENRMERILAYIKQHYTEKLELNKIALQEGLTPTYLSHFFKKHLNQSFQSYVNTLRLEHAIYLMRNTNLKIIDICIASGFSDSKYLNKQFDIMYHMTPSEFRRQHKQLFSHTRESTDSDHSIQQKLSMEESLFVLRKHHFYKCDEHGSPNKILSEASPQERTEK